MIKYSDYSPTSFDSKGLVLDDQQDWLVLGLIKTRDSDCLDNSNFDCALNELGGESDVVEVHRFGHWGSGWFEIILIDPQAEYKIKIAEDIERSLANDPILDGELYSELEYKKTLHIIDDLKPYYVNVPASTIIDHLYNFDHITEEKIFNIAFEHNYIDILDAFDELTDTQIINYLNLHLNKDTKLVLNLLATQDISEMFEHWCADYIVTNHKYDYDTIALTLEMLPRNERLQNALNCIVPENQLAFNY